MLEREGSPHSRDDLRHDYKLKWTPKNARISCDETEKLVIKVGRPGWAATGVIMRKGLESKSDNLNFRPPAALAGTSPAATKA
jgi:hypothetical protein